MQQHGGWGQKVQIQFFSEHGQFAYQIKENHKCSNMVANVLPADCLHPPDPGVEVKVQISTFSEHGHVAYQIKGKHECSNIANILSHPPSPDPRDGVNRSKVNFFRTRES